MPRGDRTGPDGQGPKTGRGGGNCGGSNKNVGKQRTNQGRGSGQGLKKGSGQGCRRR